MKYVFVANVYPEGCGYSVIIPEVEGAVAQGETLFEALTNAESALAEIMVAYENFQAGRGEEMLNKIHINGGLHPELGGLHTLIKVDTDVYRKNPSSDIELWYSPKTKKYYTMLADDNAEVKPNAEEMLRKVSGVS